jgi:hypothetical protein
MSQPSETLLLLDQLTALLDEEDGHLFFTPSTGNASSPSAVTYDASEPRTPIATPRRKTPQNKTPTSLSTGPAEFGSSAGPSSRSLAQRTVTSPASASTTRPNYPEKWTKGHDEALVILSASVSLLHRQYLQKLPFFEPWSGYGWSHLSTHLRKAMRNSLRAQGCNFELPNLSKGSSGGGTLPDEVVQAMEDAIMRGSEGGASPAGTSLPVTPRRRPQASTSSQSPLAKKSNSRRRLKAGAAPPLASEEEELADEDSTASSTGLQTPPPRARPKRSSTGKRPAALSLLKGLTSSDDEEEDSLCSGAKRRRRRRSPSTDSALDELWEPQTPTVDRTSRSAAQASRSSRYSGSQSSVKTPTRPSARPLVQTSTSPLAPAQDAARELPGASQQFARVESMCIDLTLSEED